MAGVLVYDADCAFCTRAAGYAPKLRLAIGICPMQSVDLEALGVDRERATRVVPFVDAAGKVSYGHRAVAEALRTGPLPLRIIAAVISAPGISLIAAGIYRLVAANRHRLPGGTAACQVEPDTRRA